MRGRKAGSENQDYNRERAALCCSLERGEEETEFAGQRSVQMESIGKQCQDWRDTIPRKNVGCTYASIDTTAPLELIENRSGVALRTRNRRERLKVEGKPLREILGLQSIVYG
mmetsp:Transcript_41226/g.110161  ORF Transcript_41226/g.110161 Transcript_41226/m.110161 type:complete len:113 (-) Transcript_41226:174-512(-)